MPSQKLTLYAMSGVDSYVEEVYIHEKRLSRDEMAVGLVVNNDRRWKRHGGVDWGVQGLNNRLG